ncbi:hypothetical protein PINS_up020754 [Pythium insidiosum]|nr:hypothetical protein PINS_up020754 [Pythium insidiosum]
MLDPQAIQLMEQWRKTEKRVTKVFLMWLAATTLGGCGIWSMHFTGMQALQMRLEDNTLLEVNFEGGMTLLSLLFAILGVFVGLLIASKDPFFLELESSRRKELLTKGMQNMTMEAMVKQKNQVSKQIKFNALFSRLWRILGGGIFAAIGVLAMHYCGMTAQRTNATMTFHSGVVVASALVALFAASAAFWILFRGLTFWPHYESLRLGSALIMGVAVCGTHYCGMGAAEYKHSPENLQDRSRLLFSGKSASNIASHASLLLSYWLSSFAVVVTLRKEIASPATSKNGTTAAKSRGGPSMGNFSGNQSEHNPHSLYLSAKKLNSVAPGPSSPTARPRP